jgi:hypothetical protein
MNEIVTESNQFFNPDHYDTHVVGFVEELVMSTETAYGWKMLGTRRLPGLPDRPIGSAESSRSKYEIRRSHPERVPHPEVGLLAPGGS